jgi:ADP-ribosylglycohydrolase
MGIREINDIYGMIPTNKLIPISCIFLILSLSSFENKIKQEEGPSIHSKIEGMLMGSAIGDAAGGPVEFVDPPKRSVWTTSDQRITKEGIKKLGTLFKLRPYPKDVEPFAQWESYGPEGTITDDTRFKLILFNTLKNYNGELTQQNFARSVLDFREELPEKYRDDYDRWIPEIAYATEWALGERENAYPVERIWGGIPTMEGQMPFLPIAALNPMDPEWCYLKCYELGYFDIGIAKDINSALVAGLARALQKDGNWKNFEEAMRTVDPYRYNDVLYVDRQLIKWLDLSHHLVRQADGNIAKLFNLLEENLATTYWWETWVPVVVVMACAEIVDYDPLASMQLMIEFGHDTDSYAQVMGAVMGAIHGKDVWPIQMSETVNLRMKEQFNQNVDDWMLLVNSYKISPK